MPRYVYFTFLGKHRFGQVTPEGVVPLRGTLFDETLEPGAEPMPWHLVTPDPPVRPSKIVCIGRNYRAHAEELGHEVPSEPLLFLKPPSALIGDGGEVVFPTGQSELVHHEGELAVVIGRRTRHVPPERAREHIFGYTVFNDVTARDLQRKDVQFTRGKGFDTFAPMGPWVDTDFQPADQILSVKVNGELRQRSPLSLMIFPVEVLVSYISRVMTLEQGDVIATGTPEGVGPLLPGDEVTVEIEGLGLLSNRVVADPEAPRAGAGGAEG
ncbi:MAG: fumarylacetoacetate hydrolase family protein [Deltaproteobacteria bacterium]|nr:fumarylacetoacetate hydrolase family protein [Deltaproteobacteria bacterium]MCB9786472.1 fumarylacetoacetate hydrolase family protein [Deltaproteobacteria bacterium]